MPLQRRIPKRGFRRLQKNEAVRARFAYLNLGRLTGFTEGENIDPVSLVERGLVAVGQKIKILGGGELKNRLTVHAHAFSGSARAKIEALGGSAIVVGN